MDPRGDEPRHGNRPRPLDLGAVPLPELLHLVPTLNRGLPRRHAGTRGGDRFRDLLPVVRLEVPAAESVPFVAVAVDERGRLLEGPARRRQPPGALGDGGDLRIGGGGRFRLIPIGNWIVSRRRIRIGHGSVSDLSRGEKLFAAAISRYNREDKGERGEAHDNGCWRRIGCQLEAHVSGVGKWWRGGVGTVVDDNYDTWDK